MYLGSGTNWYMIWPYIYCNTGSYVCMQGFGVLRFAVFFFWDEQGFILGQRGILLLKATNPFICRIRCQKGKTTRDVQYRYWSIPVPVHMYYVLGVPVYRYRHDERWMCVCEMTLKCFRAVNALQYAECAHRQPHSQVSTTSAKAICLRVVLQEESHWFNYAGLKFQVSFPTCLSFKLREQSAF